MLEQIEQEDLRRTDRLVVLERRVDELERRILTLTSQATGCVDAIDGLVEWLRKLDQDDIELMEAGPACDGVIGVSIAAGEGYWTG